MQFPPNVKIVYAVNNIIEAREKTNVLVSDLV